ECRASAKQPAGGVTAPRQLRSAGHGLCRRRGVHVAGGAGRLNAKDNRNAIRAAGPVLVVGLYADFHRSRRRTARNGEFVVVVGPRQTATAWGSGSWRPVAVFDDAAHRYGRFTGGAGYVGTRPGLVRTQAPGDDQANSQAS